MTNCNANATNSIAKPTNSTAKATNSIANGTNSIAKATNSIAKTYKVVIDSPHLSRSAPIFDQLLVIGIFCVSVSDW